MLIFFVGALEASPEAKRIQAHLTIKNTRVACEEGKDAVARHPDDKELWRAYIAALAAAGREREMMRAWRQSGLDDPQILETMAWGVLEEGARSQAPMTRLYSLVAALYSQDMRGVNLLHRSLQDGSALQRFAAVQLAAELRDRKLQMGVMRLLQEERHPMVRVAGIQALGKMHVKESKELLIGIAREGSAEERAAAVQSLALMFEEISDREMGALVRSDRAGLRALAAGLAMRLEQHGEIVKGLVRDHDPEVRAAAWTAVGLMGLDVKGNAEQNERVAIHEAWVRGRRGESGAFDRLMQAKERKVRLEAAGALAATGQVEEMARYLDDEDPLVGMNVALGLIGQRSHLKAASRKLAKGLEGHERLMWREAGGYRALVLSEVAHQPMIPQYPEAVNQAVRLEILNVLAINRAPEAKEAMKRFLKERPWGISGMAAALLLTEGDETALQLVQEMLDEGEQRVRIQAALVLALWGRDKAAIETLEKSFGTASREIKERILEGLGRIGDRRSVPFLVERLEEPHQTLRVLAAMALLQCLYH